LGEKLVALYEDEGKLVGYNFIKIHPLRVATRTVWVVGSSAGFLPGHTGGNRTMLDGIRAVMGRKLRHPQREFFFVSFIANPGGYGMLVDLCPSTFPSVHRQQPQALESTLISGAARLWGIKVLAEDPIKLFVSPRIPCEPFMKRHDDGHVSFYESLNPRYAEGDLLGVCVRLGFKELLLGAYRQLRRRWRKRRPIHQG
jgi:hypothetical protein